MSYEFEFITFTLKPLACPFCADVMGRKDDHHGEWYGHERNPGPCPASIITLHTEKDVKEWNVRPPVKERKNPFIKDGNYTVDVFAAKVDKNIQILVDYVLWSDASSEAKMWCEWFFRERWFRQGMAERIKELEKELGK